MIHIVFDEKDAEPLKAAIELNESLKGEVWIFNDDFSVGPLIGIKKSDGELIDRKQWMVDEFNTIVEDETLSKIEVYLRENSGKEVWLWMAPNAKDVCGYYFLIHQLKKYQGSIYTVWLNNLPFLNEKGLVFYPMQLREIPAKEFLKAKRLAVMATGAVFETDFDEWDRLKQEHSFLRVLDGRKKILSKSDDFYDRYLIAQLKSDWQKCDRIVREASKSVKEIVNSQFLLWRLKKLIVDRNLLLQGEMTSSNFEVKINKPAEETIDE